MTKRVLTNSKPHYKTPKLLTIDSKSMGALVITKLWVSYIAINQNIKVTVKEPLNRQKKSH